jgi:hypothetical protein
VIIKQHCKPRLKAFQTFLKNRDIPGDIQTFLENSTVVFQGEEGKFKPEAISRGRGE